MEEDEVLVARALDGDAEGYAEIVRRHGGRVRRIVASRVREGARRDDLVQHVFALAYRRLADLADRARLGAWLARIARHSAADERRRRARLCDRERPLDGAGELAARPEAPRWIWDEVARLPAAQREALFLRYRDGLSLEEIGRALGVPASTARGRLFEARKALRARLEGGGGRP